ncbi:DUF899-domain-containing protein [Aspergillus karnatakaensis]|uniref:DUF899-domain-containing protein n=1 Tax=Aspergillus karnatakaensis TaxID=1810916 RepID=UPI003CCDF36E
MSNKTPAETYLSARAALLEEEKEATALLQSIAASRRTLPRVPIENPSHFKFDTPTGEKSLLDLFENRKQLIIYHFMLAPGEIQGCMGCTFCMDHIPNLCHLQSRDTSFVAIARASVSEIEAYKARMGWGFPFYSCAKTVEQWRAIEEEGGVVTWKPGNGYFGLDVFFKDGEDVWHTYGTTDRGVEGILSTYALLDLTPLGRQEVGNGMNEFRRVDEY